MFGRDAADSRPSVGAGSPSNLRPSLGDRRDSGNRTPGNGLAFGRDSQNGVRAGDATRNTLRPNLPTANGNGQANRGDGPGVRVPLAGRVTPQNVRDFLSMPANRSPSGLRGDVGRQFGRGSGNNVNRVTNVNNINSFNRLNVTKINNINTNINTGFRNFGGRGFNRGFGWNTGFGWNSGFGFGFGSPYWNNWCSGVRGFWNPFGYSNCFTPRFWATNYCYFPWQRSYYWWGQQPWSYWWNTPSWGGLCNWFDNYGWSTPNYYGYGPGGNVIFSGDQVYIDDQPVATVEDYAASAATLAEVPPPANPDMPTEWMPLGTFAMSTSETDKNPPRVVQLAVDKDGIVSGTMFNQETSQTFPIQGRVDKDTQRVAFTVGDNKDVVFETGVYNLTQQQTPVLVHGDGRNETYLMLRVETPKSDAAAPAPPTPQVPPPAPPAAGPALPGPIER